MKKVTVNSNLNTVGGELDELDPEIMQPEVFNLLRKCGWRELPWKRYVVLSFDIISLKILNPSLTAKDLKQLPPFLLFFAMQIINTKTFQPIGKVFLRKTATPELVASCIKSFIRDLMKCEYFVVATVCRPICFFQKVLQTLVENDPKKRTDAYLYRVDHLKIIHLYDPINMLENTFVLFLKFAISYKKDNADFLAMYDDCKTVMFHSTARDIVNYVFNNTNNITCAVRLFSMTFYREVQECISKGTLKNIGSAEFCAFFDVLFDSLHGDIDECTSKINRSLVTKTSPHFQVWKKSLIILSTMQIVDQQGTKICSKNENSPDFKINDDYEHYEILDFTPQLETENITEIGENMDQVLEKIEEVNLENGKYPLHEKHLDSVAIEYDGKNINETVSVEESDNKKEDFSDDNGSCLGIRNQNLDQNIKENNCSFTTINSENITTDNLTDYLKKLYLALRNSESSDVIKMESNVNNMLKYEDDYLKQTTENWIIDFDKDYATKKLHMEKFSNKHFNESLNYSEHFIKNDCMSKRTKYSKIYNRDHKTSNNLIEKCEFNESDFIDETEIAYSKEAIISNDSYKEHEDIEYHPFDKYYKPNKKSILKIDIVNENCQELSDIINSQETNNNFKRATISTTMVENILVALGYIRTRLESNKSEQTLAEVINYLKTCDVIDSNVISQDKLDDPIYIINESLENMMTVLSNNSPNDSEKDIACINLVIIKQHLKELDQANGYLQNKKQKKTCISDTPDFFGSKNFNKKSKIESSTDKICKNINEISTKILPKTTIHEKTETKIGKKSEVEIPHILNNTEDAKNRDQHEKHAQVTKNHTDIKVPDLNETNSNTACINKMEVSFEDNFPEEKRETCLSEENFRPYVFDAWQVTINGVKKLFQFLQRKRFKMLNMNSFNIDHIRQIVNDVRKDHGQDIGNTYHITMTLINPSAAPHVFETHGTLILE